MIKKIFYFALLFQVLVAQTDPKKRLKNEGFVKASIVKLKLDGCNWLIKTSDKKLLLPENGLDSLYMKNKKKIWIKYSPSKNGNSICMTGIMVRILGIKERK